MADELHGPLIIGMATDNSAKTIFDILRDYYDELTRFLGQSDRELATRGPSVARMIEAHEAAFERALYPRLSYGQGAQCAAMASVQATNLVSLLETGEMGRCAAIRRVLESYLVQVHQPIVVAAKMHFGWCDARSVGRDVWRSLCTLGVRGEAAA